MRKIEFQRLIQEADFKEMFISHMGWNNYIGNAQYPEIVVEDTVYQFYSIAERSGFQIVQCIVDEIPVPSRCKAIDSRLRSYAYDHIAIYVLRDTEHHLWVSPVNQMGKRELVSIEYARAAQTDFLYSKIDNLSFDLMETTTITDVKTKVQAAFTVNSERVTRDFYTGFKQEHTSFSGFIRGIDDSVDLKKNRNKQWYTSVMLNRLMFCYFIQKKGFLDGDFDYLRHKLEWCQQEKGENRFFSTFYKGFLLQLFQDGLNSPSHKREFEQIYGRIPYLNGGLFDQHQIEQDYHNIDIDDEAFKNLFDFFDNWRWHLDTRISASGRDINPDVLGYIFEQYINDRAEMGAYYTKEDITEYIGRNCILPFLLEKTEAPINLSQVERLAKRSVNPDEDAEFISCYIFDAVRQGYSLNWRNLIPDNIACGLLRPDEDATKPVTESNLNLLERRKDWNTPTPVPFALPTEIWRETIERFQRCEDINSKIAKGEIVDVNDFITYNLDIRQYTLDLLTVTEDHQFVRHFYQALQHITILDPTCGSGAFLFAAMNILEPLYEICIERMQEFNRRDTNLFAAELDEIRGRYHSNIQYFIYKSIILRNLYGVDIMQEATEIAKLRLFLKMVAVVDVDSHKPNLGLDPLPDIDFNIRCGNTLVGYATEEDVLDGSSDDFLTQNKFLTRMEVELESISKAFACFHTRQLAEHEDLASVKDAKVKLKERLATLTDLLDHQLFSASNHPDFNEWKTSHQPFHWIAEYYQIIHGNGGFDVIIGNPPYVVYTRRDRNSGVSVEDKYRLVGYDTLPCNNLYAFCIERSLKILNGNKHIGMIVPLSLSAAKNMLVLRNLLYEGSCCFVSSYEIRPAKLFDGGEGADQRLNIFISSKSKEQKLFTTKILRWNAEHRNILFKNIFYTNSIFRNRYWRFSNAIEHNISDRLYSNKALSIQVSSRRTKYDLQYRSAGLRYWIIFLNNGFGTNSASNSELYFSRDIAPYYMAALNSNLFWWYYANNFDMFNLTAANIKDFPLDYDSQLEMQCLALKLECDMNAKRNVLVTNKRDGEINETFAYQKKLSKPIIDEIDKILACHYGFTEEELDFIINYDIKYRMGDELDNNE